MMTVDREQLFGQDLRVEARAAGLDVVAAVGDVALACGSDNIEQALRLRLMVRRGELAPLGWPDYGSRLHELIGEPNITRTHLKAMAFARSAVEQDPRVLEVEEVRTQILEGEREVLRVHMEIRLIDEPNPLNLIFDLAL
jgi:phage baseplate assembly protein W